jgi:hypothetical protein
VNYGEDTWNTLIEAPEGCPARSTFEKHFLFEIGTCISSNLRFCPNIFVVSAILFSYHIYAFFAECVFLDPHRTSFSHSNHSTSLHVLVSLLSKQPYLFDRTIPQSTCYGPIHLFFHCHLHHFLHDLLPNLTCPISSSDSSPALQHSHSPTQINFTRSILSSISFHSCVHKPSNESKMSRTIGTNRRLAFFVTASSIHVLPPVIELLRFDSRHFRSGAPNVRM